MRIAIRVDASHTLGAGHLSRCLTLARALLATGAEASFLSQSLSPAMAAMVTDTGANLHALDPTKDDATQCVSILQENPVDWLIVDHYQLDADWEKQLTAVAQKILVIDDLANRPHHCDVLLDQNLIANAPCRYEAHVDETTTLLLGSRYALLRHEFLSQRAQLKPQDKTGVQKVLVSFGGSDPTGETTKTLDALSHFENLSVDVVLGGLYEDVESIQHLCESHPNWQCYHQTDQMPRLMAEADLCIGASGTSSWERCCLGLPTLLITVAENQVPIARALAGHGAAQYLGSSETVSTGDIRNALEALLGDPVQCQQMSNKALELVDGLGVRRVLHQLIPPEVRLRLATEADCEAIYAWRNHESARRFSRNPDPIPYNQHQSWYAQTLQNPQRVLLVGEHNGDPVGVLRYDLTERQAVVSVYLVPEQQGLGYGPRLLAAGNQWLNQQYPAVCEIAATVLPSNSPSSKVFHKAGYRETGRVFDAQANQEVIQLEYNLR